MAASNLETRLERGKLDELTVTKIISMLRSSQDKVKFISDNLRAYAHPREHSVQKENIKFKNFVSEIFNQLKNAYSIEQVLELDVDRGSDDLGESTVSRTCGFSSFRKCNHCQS
ncbi:MAG: hypothetical protein CL674_11455 [Bdellovibrionaceae bacterium]|nr:hypothetical protein [Pseudobdellovibrionaceae bacterium]